MTTFQKYLLALLTAGFVGVFAFQTSGGDVPMLGAGDSTQSQIYSIPTNSSTTLSASISTLIVATSTSRNALVISNDSNNTVYLSIGATAVPGKGIRLNASSTYELNPLQMFTGAIYGYTTATSNISYIESVKP